MEGHGHSLVRPGMEEAMGWSRAVAACRLRPERLFRLATVLPERSARIQSICEVEGWLCVRLQRRSVSSRDLEIGADGAHDSTRPEELN